MQISFHPKSATEARISIKVEPSDYERQVIDKLQSSHQEARVAKGKLAAILDQQYAKEVVEQVIMSIVEDALIACVQSEEIFIVGDPVLQEPQVLQSAPEGTFQFDYDIGMLPPFACPLSKSITVTSYQIESVTEASIDELVESLRRLHGRGVAASESQVGDTLHGILSYPARNIRGEIKIDILSDTAVPELIGVKAADTLTFDLKALLSSQLDIHTPEELYEVLVGKTGEVEIEVVEIVRNQSAALDASLFSAVLGADAVQTAAAFREALRDVVLGQHQAAAEKQLQQSIRWILLTQASIEVPAAFLKAQLLEQGLAASATALEATYPQYAEIFKWTVLSDSLCEEYAICPTFEDLVASVKEEVQHSQGQPVSEAKAEELTKEFLEEMEEEKYEELYAKVRMDQLFDLIKEKITVEQEPISAEAFNALTRAYD